MNISHKPSGLRFAGFPLSVIALLIVTAAISLLWSHYKLMSQDEFFALQTDSAASVARLIHIQRTTPISLDPLVSHLLAHVAMRLFGVGPFALRLSSFLGYLLMQVCLFFIVRHMAGERAGIFALAFPALTATLFYSAEGRPYGLLLGLYALTLLAWQSATRKKSQRMPALVALALAVAFTLNSHYFGILLLIPLCAAEIFRSFKDCRVDIPVVTAIFVGMAAIVFAVPFQKAAGEFRQHYYNGRSVSLRAVSQSYRALFIDYTHFSLNIQHFIAVLLVVLSLGFVVMCVQRLRSGALTVPGAEMVFIVVLCALPLFGFLLARFVTHSIEVRYVLGAIVGITVLLSIVLAPVLERLRFGGSVVAILFIGIAVSGLIRVHNEKQSAREILASLVPSPELKAAMLSSPTQLLYIQDMGHFEVASYYERDPFVRSHIALLYSRNEELQWDKHDTVSLTAMHMRAFTGFPIVAYEQLRSRPGPYVFVLFHSGWDWTDQAFAEAHAQITPSGAALGGDAVSVRFPQTETAP